MRETYHGLSHTLKLKANEIIVVGTNTQGRHGKGAALWARNNAGLQYGVAGGLMGQSYGIITKDLTKQVHPSVSIEFIVQQIRALYEWANNLSDKRFLIAYSNKPNLNGYTPEQMAKMFMSAGPIPDNIIFEDKFNELIEHHIIIGTV